MDPALELGETRLRSGRRLCWAVFGDPHGSPVFWFHGTPGNRTQIPPATAREAALLGIKLVCIARPGVGRSSDTAYPSFVDRPMVLRGCRIVVDPVMLSQ